MGGQCSCLPLADARARRWQRKSSVDVVVKIGGSACTMKAQFETLNVEALKGSAQQIAALNSGGHKVAVIHGAGSFGHQHAKAYSISKGGEEGNGAGSAAGSGALSARTCEGFAKTRLSVTTLNKHVISALLEQGVPAVTMSPCPFVGTTAKRLPGNKLPKDTVQGVHGLINRGMVPVVHGDAILDDGQGVAILSGDVWMEQLCKELRPRLAVFLTDVKGVFTKHPAEPGAQMLREILMDMKTGELELPGVSMDCAAHDVTGGLKAKLQSAADVLMKAPSVEAVWIVRAGSTAAASALRGEVPEEGTKLVRKS